MSQNDVKGFAGLVELMKEQRLPTTDQDAFYQESGNPDWSGTEYNASASELEVFNDNIGDHGITTVENVGDISEFGEGYVEITYIHEESSEESESSSRIRAYKLDFQCEVSLIVCLFERGEAYDGGIDWNERDYNYYDPRSGSRDPSDESHGHFEEMQSDVEASEDWDQDDED